MSEYEIRTTGAHHTVRTGTYSIYTGPPLDLADIQGVVLRSYKMARLRTMVWRIDNAERAKACLRYLSDANSGPFTVQNAVAWETKPEYCLNIGFSADGLRALGVDDQTMQSFPVEFLAGARGRAALVGDSGCTDPSNWIAAFNSDQVHILVWLNARSLDVLESVSTRIRDEFINGTSSITRTIRMARDVPWDRTFVAPIHVVLTLPAAVVKRIASCVAVCRTGRHLTRQIRATELNADCSVCSSAGTCAISLSSS